MTKDKILDVIKNYRDPYGRPGGMITLDLHEIVTVDATLLATALERLWREERAKAGASNE